MSKKTSAAVHSNAKIKRYPDGMNRVIVCGTPIFIHDGWEPAEDKEPEPRPQNPDSESRMDSSRRAKAKCYDISRLNNFDYFITWTIDLKKLNRYDEKEVSKSLKTFLRNMVHRHDLKYLVLPEHHKDQAIHIHGLVSGDLELVDSGKKYFDKIIYNMPQWKYGWSTAVATNGDSESISRYITKYISKEFAKIFGNFTMLAVI